MFVYGTLLPGEVRWQFLDPHVTGDGVPDHVPGVLYDTGVGYPAAVFGRDGDDVGTIVGMVFELREESLAAALAHLDEIEGAVAGLYRRVEVTTASGARAWAYEYGGGLELVPITGGSWRDRYAPAAEQASEGQEAG